MGLHFFCCSTTKTHKQRCKVIENKICNHWRSQDFVLRGPENREFETSNWRRVGRGMGRGYPSRLAGLGERRRPKLPQRVPGQSPGRKRILVHFELEKMNLVMTKLIFFLSFYSAYLESNLQGFDIFFSFAGGRGARPLRPPLATPLSVISWVSQLQGHYYTRNILTYFFIRSDRVGQVTQCIYI